MFAQSLPWFSVESVCVWGMGSYWRAGNLPCIAPCLWAVGRNPSRFEGERLSAYGLIFSVFNLSWCLICPSVCLPLGHSHQTELPFSLPCPWWNWMLPLDMIEEIFQQSQKNRNSQVTNISLKQFHSKTQILKQRNLPGFFFSWSELGQPNAEIWDRPNTCNLC